MSTKAVFYAVLAPVTTGAVGLAVDSITASVPTAVLMTAIALGADKTRIRAFALAAGISSAGAVLAVDYKNSLERSTTHSTAYSETITPPKVG